MKRVTLFMCFLMFALHIQAQDLLEVDTVFALPGISKETSFIKASEWIASKYNSANDAVQLSDKEAGIIICKGMFQHEYGKSMTYGNLWGNIYYTLTIKFKDDRIKITVKDFKHETRLPGNMISVSLGAVNTGDHPKWGKKKHVKEYWNDLKSTCTAYGYNIINGLYEFITNTDNDDW